MALIPPSSILENDCSLSHTPYFSSAAGTQTHPPHYTPGGAANFGDAATDRSNIRVKIDKSWQYITPAPLLSFSSSTVVNGASVLGQEYNINLTGYIFANGGTDTQRNQSYINSISYLIANASKITGLEIYSDPAVTQPVGKWEIDTATASMEETTLNNASRYTISMVGFYNSTSGVLYGLSSFSSNETLDRNYEIGVPNQGGTVYNYTKTVSATARPGSSSDSVSKIKSYVKSSINAADYSAHDYYANLKSSETSDHGNTSFSKTLTGFLINKTNGSASATNGYFIKYSTRANADRDSASRSVSIDGKITGFKASSGIPEASYDISVANDQALIGYNSASNNGTFNYASDVYSNALSAGGSLNFYPKSVAVSDGTVPGDITFSVEYDNRPYNLFNYSVAENITVTDKYPNDAYNVVQVPGRDGGLIQYMNSSTNYERDIVIEITIDKAYLPNTIAGLMNGPSMDINQGILKDILDQLSPSNNGTSYAVTKNLQESWSPKEGKYTLNAGWVYVP